MVLKTRPGGGKAAGREWVNIQKEKELSGGSLLLPLFPYVNPNV